MKGFRENAQGGVFWKKIKRANEEGLKEEEFIRIEEIEAMITELENKLEECQEEIKKIKREAGKRKRKEKNVVKFYSN